MTELGLIGNLFSQLTFIELIIINYVIIMLILLIALLIPGSKYKEKTPGVWAKLGIVGTTMGIMFTSFYPGGLERPIIFFILEGLLGAMLLYSYSRKTKHLLLLALIISMVITPVSVYTRNNFYPISSIHLEPLYQTGRILRYQEAAIKSKLYYYIPIDPLVTVPVSLATGIEYGITFLQRIIYLFITILLLYVILERLKISRGLGTLMLLITMPPLSFITGRVLPIPYVTLYLMLIIINLNRPNPLTITTMLIVGLVTVFSHPIGALSILPLLFFTFITLKRSNISNSTIKLGFVIITLITTIYWLYTHIMLIMTLQGEKAIAALQDFITMIFGQPEEAATGSISPYLAPGYTGEQFKIFALTWAGPIAIATITLIYTGILILKRFAGLIEIIMFSASASCIIYLTVSYVSYTTGYETGQYSLAVLYYLALLTTPYIINQIMQKRKILIKVSSLLLLILVSIGTYVPDWAPLEHQNFEVTAKMHPYVSYIERNIINELTASKGEMTIYNDYDIDVTRGIYKGMRIILWSVINGNSTFWDYCRSGCRFAIFILKTTRLQKSSLTKEVYNVNLIYYSNCHLTIAVT